MRGTLSVVLGSAIVATLGLGWVAQGSADAGPDTTDTTPEATVLEVGTRVDDAVSVSYSGDRKAVTRHPGATYIKVSFDALTLAGSDYITVSDPDGDEVHRYHGDPRTGDDVDSDASFTVHGKQGFAAMSIEGDTAIVRLHSNVSDDRAESLTEQGFGAQVSGFWRGYDAKELRAANPKSVCGADARRDAICYEQSNPEEYASGRAVARVLMAGGSLCTAWRVGDGNAMLTNNHCMSDQGEVAASESQFDYECATCDGADPKEPVKVGGAELAATSAGLDYTLYSVDAFDTISEFGTLYLETREADPGERIYIPGHGDGEPKRIAIYEESDGGEECTIDEPDSGDGVNLGYSCDTSGGNSGSPVIAGSSHRVIGLHHLGGCPTGLNYGTRMALIYPEIADLIENG